MARYFRHAKDGNVEYVVTEDCVVTRYEQVAAWSTTIAIKAGVYPAKVERDGSAVVSVPGTIVEDWFPSLFGGVQCGKPYDRFQNAGKPAYHSSYCYRYQIEESSNDQV